MRYIYCDESTFAEPTPCNGVGMLITDNAISQSLIDEALRKLNDDPDRLIEPAKSLDDRTLERHYFHASEDSKNAHSHLCDQINKIEEGEFVCDFLDKTHLPAHEQYDTYLYRQATILSSVKATYTTKPIVVHFENREDISIDSLTQIYKDLVENNLMGIYDLPFVPHYFPCVEFKIVDKLNPGAQCADFILWTVNRHINGDDVWLQRIKSHFKTNFSTESGSWGGRDIKLGTGLNDSPVYYTFNDFPVDPDRQLNNNLFTTFYLHASKVVEYYFNNAPPHIEHLLEEARDVVDNKTNQFYYEYFTKLAVSYLKIFDMAPVINSSTSLQDKEFLLLSKKYMSLLLRRDLINGVRTKIWIEQVRREILKNKPELLNS